MASRQKYGAQKRKEKRKRDEDYRGERDHMKRFLNGGREGTAGLDSVSKDDGGDDTNFLVPGPSKTVNGSGGLRQRQRVSFAFAFRDTVQYWAERGVEVVAWTVNTAVEKRYYEQQLNINYITDSLTEDCETHY